MHGVGVSMCLLSRTHSKHLIHAIIVGVVSALEKPVFLTVSVVLAAIGQLELARESPSFPVAT